MELGKLLVDTRCVCLAGVPVPGLTAGRTPRGQPARLVGSGRCRNEHLLWYIVGSRRVDFRTFHALSGRCARTEYLIGHLRRFRNPPSGALCRYKPVRRQRTDSFAGCLHHVGGYCYYRVCRQPACTKHERRGKTRCRKRLCIDKRLAGSTPGWCHECLLCFGAGCGNTYQRSRLGWGSGRTLCRSAGYLPGYAWRLPDKRSLLSATECG